MTVILLAVLLLPAIALAMPPALTDPYGIVLQPIPDKTVVLSFDDSVASQATTVAPILKPLGFGASFYICDFGSFNTRKDWYMTWPQIQSLAKDGFDVGNHTKGHGGASIDNWLKMEDEFAANNVPKPTTLCWPVYAVYKHLYPALIANGYTFGRAGGNRPYRPTVDHPLNVPSWGIQDNVSVDDFVSHVRQAADGKIVVLTFHGVPEGEHMAVSLNPATFERMVKYLKDNRYNVISMRDLAKYVDAKRAAMFLPFPDRCPWGGMTRDGDRVYVSVKKLPADRKVTLSGLTTRIARAHFAADANKQTIEITVADSGIQTLAVPQSPFVSSDDYPTVIVAQLKGGPVATILDFVVPGAPQASISGDEISVTVPMASDLTKLAPTYDTGSPLVTGKPASGLVSDFTRPQTYTVTAPDGSTRRYTVKVTRALGAVAITNPSFEKFHSAGEYDNSMESNPSGATWTFTKRQGELGIRDLVGSGGAPTPPDGSRHCVFLRGPGNSVSQSFPFDKGGYTISFDAVKRSGYEKTAAPLIVTIDNVPVFALEPSQITEKWASYTSPVFQVAAGIHTIALSLGDGDGMDMIDNVSIKYCR